MFTLRCTQRLLARLASPPAAIAIEPTTRLGDWYANLLHVGRRQLVLAISERTFLPVVITAAPAGTIVARLRVELAENLRAMGIEQTTIDNELAAMASVTVARTASRQVTGVLVDFSKLLAFWIEDELPLVECSRKLAETPCSPLYKTTTSPDRATTALLGGLANARREEH
ncbi:MAG TPA: hypothetical protein VJT73_05445 [Polyangiaceae bacterium]|nr:hypothetical protein [Polyangiaceae bacterium]